MPGRTKWMKTLGELCYRSSLKLMDYNVGHNQPAKRVQIQGTVVQQWFGGASYAAKWLKKLRQEVILYCNKLREQIGALYRTDAETQLKHISTLGIYSSFRRSEGLKMQPSLFLHLESPKGKPWSQLFLAETVETGDENHGNRQQKILHQAETTWHFPSS